MKAKQGKRVGKVMWTNKHWKKYCFSGSPFYVKKEDAEYYEGKVVKVTVTEEEKR